MASRPTSTKRATPALPKRLRNIEPKPMPGKRVLVVDDEPDIGDAIRDAIEAGLPGVEVRAALSGEEALTIMEHEAFHLIISDFRMPGMDGIEFLQIARDMSPTSPRVLITAYPQTDLADRAFEQAQVRRFLVKPFQLEDMIRLVSELLAPEDAGSRISEQLPGNWYDKWARGRHPAA